MDLFERTIVINFWKRDWKKQQAYGENETFSLWSDEVDVDQYNF